MLFFIHFAVTCALAGLIWVVQLVVYPAFQDVERSRFVLWHAAYTQRVAYLVGPLMGIELVTGMAWLAARPGDSFALAGAGLIVVNWVSTAFIQVPLHRRLEAGFEADVHRRLVATNWIRTVAWTVRAALLAGLAADSLGG